MKKIFVRHFLPFVFCLFPLSFCNAQSTPATLWVDSVMSQLSLEQQIAQLMVIRVPIHMDELQLAEFEALLARTEVGGVCFFAGTAKEQLSMTRTFQAMSRIPLWVCIDAENGLGMRLSDCYSFPHQMLLGAVPQKYDHLIFEMGEEIGAQCRKLGVDVNFAPVVDLNSNPLNPVIGIRSFGENPYRVATKALQFMNGLQSKGVLAVAKHFPGHGDTETDSHLGLPVIHHSQLQIDSVDLYPFRSLIDAGVRGVMIAHLQIDALDPRPHRPATLSYPIVSDLLHKKLGFDGLVITDGLDMQGVAMYYKKGQGELQALLAGNDILLLPPDVPAAISTIKEAARTDASLARLIDMRCRRVLREKYNSGLSHFSLDSLSTPDSLNYRRSDQLAYQLALHGVTLLKNDDVLPIYNPDRDTSILVIYESPYALARKDSLMDRYRAVILAYEDHPAVRRAVDDLIHGRAQFEGRLPVNAGRFKIGDGMPAERQNDYSRVFAAKMDVRKFESLDSLALSGIAMGAYPGCQIVVAKEGRVVFNKAYGHLSYAPDAPAVDTNTVYDIASMTKVAATTLAVMHLVNKGVLGLDDKLSHYLPYLKHSKKSNLTIKQVMSHFARLKDYEPYYEQLGVECVPQPGTLLPDASCEKCREKLLKAIAKSDLIKDQKYLYSDLGFILMGDLVQRVTGVTLDSLCDSLFYRPLGMRSTCFNPLQHGIDKNRIAPTEQDDLFRHRLVHGEVHDQNAAVMGGVAGHAGLFSTAGDLAQLFIMLLNDGYYNGHRFLSPKTVGAFNHRYFAGQGNRRGVGVDKPLFKPVPDGNTSVEVSQSSYGHTGFTGTMFWSDPESGLVFVFLSNRVHPSADNKLLSQSNLRTRMQSLIYQSLK